MRGTEHVNAQEMFGDGEVHVWLERYSSCYICGLRR